MVFTTADWSRRNQSLRLLRSSIGTLTNDIDGNPLKGFHSPLFNRQTKEFSARKTPGQPLCSCAGCDFPFNMSASDDETNQPPAVAAAAATPTTSVPPTPRTPANSKFIPLVAVVDFHHARGPEVESWFGVPDGSDPAAEFGWPLLPFMALSDGAHA